MSEVINTQSATKAEMTQVLQDEYGIDPEAKASKQDLIDLLIEQGHPINQPAPTPIEEVAESTLGDSSATAPAKKGPTGYTIMIATSETDQGDVKVAVNGIASLIRRGESVRVKPAIVEVLRNAITYRYEQVEVDGKPEQKEIRVPAYPVSILETHFD